MILLSYTSANETKCVSPDVDFCAQFTEQESPCYVEKNRSDEYRGRVSPEAALSDDASFDTAFGARLMKLRLTINGENKEVSIDTRTSLLDLIRETLGLTGTKVDSLHAIPSAKILAGGTNLVDLMKQSIEKPSLIIDINHLDLAEITELPDGGLRLGALARNADTANHPLVRQRYPMLARAILSGASPQLRNLATNGGNLLQRTRCYYFYDPAFPQCNKRNPGSGCGAVHGFNRIHAILGASPSCIASHPSDMCVALSALEARVRVQGPDGKEREIPFHEFHRLPGETPHIDTTLMPDELILSIDLPVSPYAAHSCYLKVRDRASYAFALVSVAAAIARDDQIVSSARLSLGGVAHKPWRAESAERTLVGKPLTLENLRLAADEALAGAQPYRFNAFKVETAKRAIVRAFLIAAGPHPRRQRSTR